MASEARAYWRAASINSRRVCASGGASGSRSILATCCCQVCVMPARMRVLVTVAYFLSRTIPLSAMCFRRKSLSNKRPDSSSPTIPTGSTFTPKSARLLMALAPPPGTTLRSLWRRISTGASRETRDISPNTNSSATRSPITVIVTLANDSTIFFSRSASLGCLFIRIEILSCSGRAFFNSPQNGIYEVICLGEVQRDTGNRQRRQAGSEFAQVHDVFLCRDEPVGLMLFAQFAEIVDVAGRIKVMIREELCGHRLNAHRTKLLLESFRPSDAAKYHRPRRSYVQRYASLHFPNALTL